MASKLTVLGSGGWIPTTKRQTCSYLIEMDNSLIILDAGSGISTLSEYDHVLDEYDEVNIVLSHYHLDHIVGLSFLPLFIKNKKLNIYAPSQKYYEDTASEILSTFTSFPYFSLNINSMTSNVNIHEYDEKGFYINETKVKILEQNHTAPSFGITLGSFLHYATDTSILGKTFKCAKDVQLLLHECWQLEDSKSKGHSSLEKILEKSKLCENTKIGLIHINPSWKDKDFLKAEEKIENLNIFLLEDKMELY